MQTIFLLSFNLHVIEIINFKKIIMFEINTYTQSPAWNSLHMCNLQLGNFSFIALSDLISFLSNNQCCQQICLFTTLYKEDHMVCTLFTILWVVHSVCMSVCVCVHHIHAWCWWKPEKVIRLPGPRITHDCEPLCVCWELTWSPLQGQQAPLTAEPSL